MLIREKHLSLDISVSMQNSLDLRNRQVWRVNIIDHSLPSLTPAHEGTASHRRNPVSEYHLETCGRLQGRIN